MEFMNTTWKVHQILAVNHNTSLISYLKIYVKFKSKFQHQFTLTVCTWEQNVQFEIEFELRNLNDHSNDGILDRVYAK